MITKVLQSPYKGMTPDSFYGEDGECLFMSNANIDNMKYMTIDNSLLLNYDLAFSVTPTQMLETPAGVITIAPTKVFFNALDKSTTVGSADRVEFLIKASSQVNYFINNGNVIKTNNDVSSVTTTVAKPVAGTTYASVRVYNTILFSTGSNIYSYDTEIDTISVAIDNVLSGSKINYLYFYNNLIVIVTTLGSDTIIYQAQLTETGYEIYSTEVNVGVLCLSAVGDSGSVYWVSKNRIFQFKGQTQEIRYLGYGPNLTENIITDPKLGFSDGDLYIGDGIVLYTWGSKQAGRRKYLSTKTLTNAIAYITQKYIQLGGATNKIYSVGTKYFNSCTAIYNYDTGIFGDKKSSLSINVGYVLKSSNTITISVMTDKMEIASPGTYITVATIVDTTKNRQRIDVSEINDALTTAGKDSDWQTIRIKVALNGSGGSSELRDTTPRFYDMKLKHNSIEDGQ